MFCLRKLQKWRSHTKGCKIWFCLTKAHPNLYKNQVLNHGPESTSCSIIMLSLSTCFMTLFFNLWLIIFTHIKTKSPVHVGGKRMIPFYSTNVVFMYEYFMTSSYEITNKSCSVIRSPGAPYNCPLFQLKKYSPSKSRLPAPRYSLEPPSTASPYQQQQSAGAARELEPASHFWHHFWISSLIIFSMKECPSKPIAPSQLPDRI